ncbi:hypothetical protein WG66_011765 [Moniliophthora roreri]|nr:hypothetical protein WG66_011765 [Moniliophthora roreri]
MPSRLLASLATFGTLLVLFLVHRRQRDIDREKRMQYWREQNAFHQNLNQMREAVRASILSFPGASNSPFRDGNYSDESYAPMNHQGTSKS